MQTLGFGRQDRAVREQSSSLVPATAAGMILTSPASSAHCLLGQVQSDGMDETSSTSCNVQFGTQRAAATCNGLVTRKCQDSAATCATVLNCRRNVVILERKNQSQKNESQRPPRTFQLQLCRRELPHVNMSKARVTAKTCSKAELG